MSTIYLDHGATTPMHPQVIERMTEAMATCYGNPSSIHQQGRAAQSALEAARHQLAQKIGAKANELVFTSGGTESNNMVLLQTAFGRQELGKHLITSKVEHPSILKTMAYLESQGFEVTYLGVDEEGRLHLSELVAALRPDTILVSLMHTNNETGVRFPIKEIGELLASHSAYFHTDGVQALGLEPLNVVDLGVDFLSATAHKINGPKGVGLLYMKEGRALPPLLHGGEQEGKRRAGTENVPAVVGFSAALTLLSTQEQEERAKRYDEFTKHLLAQLTAAKVSFKINGATTNKSSHILNIWFKGIPNDLLVMHLDLQGVALSIGSACTAGTVTPSHVLESMYGKGSQSTKESVRISFGLGNTRGQLDRFIVSLLSAIEKLQAN